MVDALSRRDSETNAIYNYIMLNMSYKFNKIGDSAKDKEREGMRGYGMPPAGMMPGGMPPAGMMRGGGMRF